MDIKIQYGNMLTGYNVQQVKVELVQRGLEVQINNRTISTEMTIILKEHEKNKNIATY